MHTSTQASHPLQSAGENVFNSFTAWGCLELLGTLQKSCVALMGTDRQTHRESTFALLRLLLEPKTWTDWLRKAFKKKKYEIADKCQISVTLPTLYPDMDKKKFRHIFYTLTYLPIRKIWTKLEKSWYFYKILRLFKNFTDPFLVSVTTSSAHSFSIVDL